MLNFLARTREITVVCDFGTTYTKMSMPGTVPGERLVEPSAVAVEITADDAPGDFRPRILAVGEAAVKFWERENQTTEVQWPISEGHMELTDLAGPIITQMAMRLLGKEPQGLLDQWMSMGSYRHRDNPFKDRDIRFLSAVPPNSRSSYLSAVRDVAKHAFPEARNVEVNLVTQTLAAAVGSGVSIDSKYGNMVMGMGGGTIDVSVISELGEVSTSSLRTGGRQMDKAVQSRIREAHSINTGQYNAELYKIELGSAISLNGESKTKSIKGISTDPGNPGLKEVEISTEDIFQAVNPILAKVELMIQRHVQTKLGSVPRLTENIAKYGIVATGGPARMPNLQKRLEDATHIKVEVPDEPQDAVIMGMEFIMADPKILERVRIRLP